MLNETGMILIKLSTNKTGQVLTEFYYTEQQQLEEQHTDYGKPLLPAEGTGYETLLHSRNHSRPIALFASETGVSHCQG